MVSAVYDVPPGCVWPTESIERIKAQAAAHGLAFEVVESVPVHEDIKLGKPTRDKYIEAYCENIRRLGRAGVKCICYNFMPVFDWLRSDLAHKNTDGSTSLIYRHEQVLAMDPAKGGLSLPAGTKAIRRRAGRAAGGIRRRRRGSAVGQLGVFHPRDYARLRGSGREYGHPPGRPAVGYFRPAAHRDERKESGPAACARPLAPQRG